MSKIKIKVTQDEAKLEEEILNSYDACILNNFPESEIELLKRYQENTEILYQYLRAVTVDFIYPLNNEIRALFGHLAEYNRSNYSNEKELDKANGHFRRLNLDALKMICDDFDKFFLKKLKKHSKYDYRNVRVDYLKEFATKYFAAQKAYLKAQEDESVGSDSEQKKDNVTNTRESTEQTHNVIKLYYDAVKKYIQLKQYYMTNKKAIEAEQRKTIFKKIIKGVGGAFALIIGVLEILPIVIQWLSHLNIMCFK